MCFLAESGAWPLARLRERIFPSPLLSQREPDTLGRARRDSSAVDEAAEKCGRRGFGRSRGLRRCGDALAAQGGCRQDATESGGTGERHQLSQKSMLRVAGASLLAILLLPGVAALGETQLLSAGGEASSSLFKGFAHRGAGAPGASLEGLPHFLLGQTGDLLSQLAQSSVRSQAGHALAAFTISELSPSPSGFVRSQGLAPLLDGQLGDALAVFLCAFVLAWCGALACFRARGRSQSLSRASRGGDVLAESGDDVESGETTFASGVRGAAAASSRNFRGQMTFAPRKNFPARGARSSLGYT